jgi:ABC-type nickel/cobalt efflux system permease component RcnA
MTAVFASSIRVGPKAGTELAMTGLDEQGTHVRNFRPRFSAGHAARARGRSYRRGVEPLFAFAGAAILLGHAIPEHVARPLETAVGIMLVGLGVHVLWRLWRDRVHFHMHGHGDGKVHIHAHSHAGDTVPHTRAAHAHAHGFRWRTLLVGLMHGMAGSAALLLLTVSQASSPAVGLGYVALFGIGSMVGMGALSTVIAVPLAVSARWLTWANRGLQGAVGIATMAIGLATIYKTVLA